MSSTPLLDALTVDKYFETALQSAQSFFGDDAELLGRLNGRVISVIKQATDASLAELGLGSEDGRVDRIRAIAQEILGNREENDSTRAFAKELTTAIEASFSNAKIRESIKADPWGNFFNTPLYSQQIAHDLQPSSVFIRNVDFALNLLEQKHPGIRTEIMDSMWNDVIPGFVKRKIKHEIDDTTGYCEANYHKHLCSLRTAIRCVVEKRDDIKGSPVLGKLYKPMPTLDEMRENPLDAIWRIVVKISDLHNGSSPQRDSKHVIALDKALDALDETYPGARRALYHEVWHNTFCDWDRKNTGYSGLEDFEKFFYRHSGRFGVALRRLVEQSVSGQYDRFAERAKALFEFEKFCNESDDYKAVIGELLSFKPEDRDEEVAIDSTSKEQAAAFLARLPVAMRNEVFGHLYANLTDEEKAKAEGNPTYCEDHYMDHLDALEAAICEVLPDEMLQEEIINLYQKAYDLCLEIIENNPIAIENRKFKDIITRIMDRIIEACAPSYVAAMLAFYREMARDLGLNDRRRWKLPTFDEFKATADAIAAFAKKVDEFENSRLEPSIIRLILIEQNLGKTDNVVGKEDLEATKAYIGTDAYNNLLGRYYETVKAHAEDSLEQDPGKWQAVLTEQAQDPSWSGNHILDHQEILQKLLEQYLSEKAEELILLVDTLEPVVDAYFSTLPDEFIDFEKIVANNPELKIVFDEEDNDDATTPFKVFCAHMAVKLF